MAVVVRETEEQEEEEEAKSPQMVPAVVAASDITEDRISQLPGEIIHDILRRVNSSTAAVRTSILSRRWLQLWRSYPVVEFRRGDMNHSYEELITRFQSFAAATSRRLLNRNNGETVPSLLMLDALRIISPYLPGGAGTLEQLMTRASGGRSPLEILVHACSGSNSDSQVYRCPVRRFLNCPRTRTLDLTGCYLTMTRTGYHCKHGPIRFDSLQELRLCRVWISNQFLQSCLANAPNLQTLRLGWMSGVDTLYLSHSNLKSFRVEGHPSYLGLHLVSVPLLETLSLSSEARYCKVKLASKFSAPNLKSVEIPNFSSGLRLVDLEDLVSRFPALESIDFHKSFFRASTTDREPAWLKISTCELREFTFRQSDKSWVSPLVELEIDAPNLVNLCIVTESPVEINVVNVGSNCKCVVDWHIVEDELTTEWFVKLRRFLAVLADRFCHPVLKLHFRKPVEEVSFDAGRPECTSSSPLPVQHIQWTTSLSSGLAHLNKAYATLLLDGLFWACHTKTISVTQCSLRKHYYPVVSRNRFFRVWKELKDEEVDNCCAEYKCWRHEQINVELNFDTVDEKSALAEDHICFTLT